MNIWTTKTGAKVLGIKQDTLKHYAVKFSTGFQPGGSGTPWFFTMKDLLIIRNRAEKRGEKIEKRENREILGLGALYNPDASPRR